MEDKGVRDLRDLARETPGLTIGSAEGGNAYGAFAIRGFKANNDIFVDSIRNPGNVVPDVFAVEQVEIYKGPSGGIAGRSTIGGAINLITKQPDLNFNYYEVETTIGTDNTVPHDDRREPGRHATTSPCAPTSCTTSTMLPAATSPTASGGAVCFRRRRGRRTTLKVTLDYYRYRNDAIPDWGVPVLTRTTRRPPMFHRTPSISRSPNSDISRDMFVGMAASTSSTSRPTSARRPSSPSWPTA